MDLLIHLLTNLRQSLIVCGPEGIGKTTLLKTLRASREEVWPVCLLQGSSALSFETVLTLLSQFLNLNSAVTGFDLQSLRALCERQKVVLMIDDAGNLVPGLIGELIDFADSLPGLRLVFAMNYDEFQHKTDSDRAVDSCHFIELPPLNQRQCMEYLQNLSARHGAMLSFDAITDTLVEQLYRKTQGIPGKILAELPKAGQSQSRHNRKLGFWLGAGLIVGAFGYIAKDLLPPQGEETATEAVSQTPGPVSGHARNYADTTVPAPAIYQETEPGIAIETQKEDRLAIAPEIPETSGADDTTDQNIAVDILTETPIEPDAKTATTATPKVELEATASRPEIGSASEQTEPSEPEALEPAKPIVQAKPADSTAEQARMETDRGDTEWIMAQPANNYTVQLMVLSYKKSVDRFMRQHAEYRDNLKYYTIGKRGQEKYVLIFGSFQSATDALKSKSTMPDEFNQGIVKRFKYIQKESLRRK
ncbi:AAA family ATPase [Methylomonas sp. MgM2]